MINPTRSGIEGVESSPPKNSYQASKRSDRWSRTQESTRRTVWLRRPCAPAILT